MELAGHSKVGIESPLLRVAAQRRSGQAMAEYGLILAGIAAVVIVAMDRFDAALGALFNRIAASLS